MTGSAQQLGQQAESSDWIDLAARAGLIAYGVVHLVIAILAVRLAFGDGAGSASTKGALHEIAQQPFGIVLVWAIAIGMFLLVLWRVVEAIFGHREEDGAKRVRKRLVSAGKAVIYGSIGFSALKVAIGAKSSGNAKSMTAKLMDLPAGPWIVVLLGLAIIGYGGNTAWRGISEKYAEHLDAEGKSGDSGKAYLLFGKIGYIAKGVSLGLVGVLFCYAGFSHDANNSGGMDQALHRVLQEPFGAVLLALIGAGIGCYGLFCFARARHLSR